jgi:hypothetical protein
MMALADYVPDTARWPRLGAYIAGILDRPAVASIRD